jgi:glucose/arabinose dehydrogenase
VGEAINPVTGELWCSTNERDELGNHLVPDYITSVPEGGFFGWPWYYMGGHQDPRLTQPCADGTGNNPQASTTSPHAKDCKHVDLHAEVLTPDVLLQPHMASLEMTFYPSIGSFPEMYDGDGFAAEHGRGTAKSVLVMKSFVCRCTTGKPGEATRISQQGLLSMMIRFGVGRSVSPLEKRGACS